MIKQITQIDVTDNPFWVQYTSLILIILTFIIAIFFAPDAFRKAEKQKPRIIPQVGELTLNNVFIAESSDLKTDAIQGLVFALTNHDLDSQIFVYGDSNELALARSVMLYRELLKQGVPASAVTSYAAVSEERESQIKVHFYEEIN